MYINSKRCSLYLVLSGEYCRGRSAIEAARLAVSSGVDMLQMREKDKPKQELIELGRDLAGLCKENGVGFIVNDDPLLAAEPGADGVHLGQEDLKRCPVDKARGIIGQGKIIGVSTHSVEEAARANKDGADYIAFGPIFPTKTKDYSIGTEDIERVLEMSRAPVFFIGGITLLNADEILSRGGKNIALIRAITESDDIPSSVKGFKDRLNAQDEIASSLDKSSGRSPKRSRRVSSPDNG